MPISAPPPQTHPHHPNLRFPHLPPSPHPTLTHKPLSIKCSVATTTSPPSNATDRVVNFAAVPATLPKNVLLKAQSELYNWSNSSMSVMEMSHRGKEFSSIIQKAESDLRTLLGISPKYSVLFLQGGATTQFAAIPLNVCKADDKVDFVVTGSWGDKENKEAAKYCNPNSIWSGKSEKYTNVPRFDELKQTPGARYLHICANEMIHGVEFKDYLVPASENEILVATC